MAIQFLNTGYFPDNAKLTFGDATTPDLEIFHDGSHSEISELGTGDLRIRGDSVWILESDGTNQISAYQGTVKLYKDGVNRLETTSAGVGVIGTFYQSSGQKHQFDWAVSNDYHIYKNSTALTFNTGGTYVFNTGDVTFAGNATVAGDVLINNSTISTIDSIGSLYIDVNVNNDYGGRNFRVLNNGTTQFNIDSTNKAEFFGDVSIPAGGKYHTYTGSDNYITYNSWYIWTGSDIIIRNSSTGPFKFQTNGANDVLTLDSSQEATFHGDILTNTDSSSDIGKTATRWANIWVDNINGAAPLSGAYLPLAGGTMTGHLKLNDSVELLVGTSNDLHVYHDGSNSYINNDTGNLYIRNSADDKNIYFQTDDGSGGTTTYMKCDGLQNFTEFPVAARFMDNVKLQFGDSNDSDIYHNGTDMIIRNHVAAGDMNFSADSTGSGGSATSYFWLDGGVVKTRVAKGMNFEDNVKLTFGNVITPDLDIYSDGTNGIISNLNGSLNIIQNTDDEDINIECDNGSGGTMTYMLFDGSTKRIDIPDSIPLCFGAADDLQVQHNGSSSYIQNYTGNLTIQNNADDAAIIFQCDDGSGGVETYFQLEGISGGSQPFTVWPDAAVAAFGSGHDLRIEHDGTYSTIDNYTGDFEITNYHDDGDLSLRSDNGSGGTKTYLKLDGGIASMIGYTDLLFGDNLKLKFGDSQDLEIYHDANHSWISDQGTGNLNILTTSLNVNNAADTQNMIVATQGGSVNLYYNGTQHFRTTSSGVEVTGALSITGDGSNAATLTESSAGILTIATVDALILDSADDITLDAAGNDIRFFKNGVEYGKFKQDSSNFDIFASVQDKDIRFKGNDGGSTITALTLDMSEAGQATFNANVNAPNFIAGTAVYANAGIYYGTTILQLKDNGGNPFLQFDASKDATFASDIGATDLALSGKGTSAATVDGDGSTTMATKGWVESKLTGATLYQGTWDPDKALNSGYGNPDLSTASLQVNGYYYICSDDGIAEPNGTGTEPDTWHTGDWVIWNDDVGSGEWQKIDNTTVLSGAGTGEYLARWTDTETLGDSIVLTSGSDIIIPQYIQHTSDSDTYFGFSAANTYKVHTGGSDRFSVAGDVHVLGTTDFAIPAGRKFYLDGQSNTYITESSDGVIDFYGDNTFLVSMKQNGTQSEVVVNEGSGDVDFRVEANNDTHAFFVEAEAAGAVGIGTNDPGNRLHIVSGDEDTLRLEATSGQPAIFWYPDGSVKWEERASASTWQLYSYDEDEWVFNLYDGKCGIGTNTPEEKLMVGGAIVSTGTNATSFTAGTNRAILDLTSGGARIGHFRGTTSAGSGSVKIYSDSVLALTIDENQDTTFEGDVTIGALTSGETAQLVVNHEGGASAVASFKARTNRAQVIIGDNDTNGYLVAENGIFGVGRTASISTNNINIDASHNVGIRTITPAANLDVQGGIIAGGKTTYSLYWGSLDTTGQAVAGLSGESGGNGASAGFIFTCFGGDGYQRIVYSCKNVGGTWDIDKDIDEGVNAFDVTHAADGSDNITFTFKARSSGQSYTPRVTVEAMGNYINQSYIN